MLKNSSNQLFVLGIFLFSICDNVWSKFFLSFRMNFAISSGNLSIDSTEFFKLELIFGMRCVIHKYAKTVEDIKRLEEVIGLPNAKTVRQFFEDKLFNEGKAEGFSEGRTEGFSEGRTEGHLGMAVKFVEKFGVDAVADASGFSRDEILKHSKK